MLKGVNRAAFVFMFAAVLLGIAEEVLGQQARTHSASLKYVDNRGREREETVAVISHTFRGLEWKRGSSTRTINNDAIISLRYSKTPKEYTDALALYDAGDLNSSIEAFQAILAEESIMRRHGWILQEAIYCMWDSNRRVGRRDVAKQLSSQLKKQVKDSRYLPHVELDVVYEFLATGQASKATKAFTDIRREGVSRKYSMNIMFKAHAGLLDALIAEGKITEAKAAYDEAKVALTGDASMEKKAEVLFGRVLLAEKKFPAALAHFTKILDGADKTDRFVIAAAANGKGDCNFELKKFDEALFDYSVAASLYFDDPELEYDVGWAFWRWAKTFQRISNAIQDPESDKKKRYGARFIKLRRRVAEEYPYTLGGQQARKELGV